MKSNKRARAATLLFSFVFKNPKLHLRFTRLASCQGHLSQKLARSSCSLDLRSADGFSEMYYPEKYLTNACISPMMLSVWRTNLLAKRQKGHESSKKAHVYRHPVADTDRCERLCKFQKKSRMLKLNLLFLIKRQDPAVKAPNAIRTKAMYGVSS